MKKLDVFNRLLEMMEERLYARKAAADTAREAATDDEARADSKYETQGLESSYLARGHALMLEGLAEDFRRLKAFTLPAFAATDPIDEGALIQVDMDGDAMWFMILPGGGGTDVVMGKTEVTILTPQTPLGEQLIGKHKGDSYQVRAGGPSGTILDVS